GRAAARDAGRPLPPAARRGGEVMPPILVIARLTVQESSRRRLLLALLVLTLVVVGFSAWGFNKITTVTNSQGQTLPPDQVALVSSQLLIVIVFMFSGVLALSAAVVAGPLISGEVESGLPLSMPARPVRPSEIRSGVGFSAWGFNKITTVTNSQGQTLPPDQVALVSSQLLIVIVFMFSGVLALSAAVVAGPLISGEVESGLLLSMLARPVRRSEI